MAPGKEWNPQQKYRTLVDLIQNLLANEKRTVRDLYYALESRGYDYDYDEVNYAVKRGRRAGYIDPSKVVDTSRTADATPSGVESDPADWLRSRVRHSDAVYNRNFWEDQPKYVEVWLEKASLSSVFAPICREYNVRLEATRGDWSDSKVYEATQRLNGKLFDGKDVRVLWFGDYNPSGFRTPVAIQRTMYCYGLELSGRNPDEDEPDWQFFEAWPWSGPAQMSSDGEETGTFKMERIGLNTKHIERFNLPENPTPTTAQSDRKLKERFLEQVTGGDDVDVELNSLKEHERDFLEDMIEEAIEDHIDEDAKDDHEDKEEDHKQDIRDAIDDQGDTIEVDLGSL